MTALQADVAAVKELVKLAEKATDAPWSAGNAQPDNSYVEGGIPAVIRHIYRDGKGRRVTEFLMTGNDHPKIPTNTNIQFAACARNSIPAIERLLGIVSGVEKLEAEWREHGGNPTNGYEVADSIKRLLHPEDK